MRFIRLLLISFVMLFLLVTGISLFIPSRVRISKAINVKASQGAIWKPIADMNNWKDWNPFFANMDSSNLKKNESNGEVDAMELNGTRISWQQKNPDELIATMERNGRKPVLNGWKLISHSVSDSTTIQWYMDFNLRWYPWEKFGSIMFERSYGPQMEKGLTNLKKLIVDNHTSYN